MALKIWSRVAHPQKIFVRRVLVSFDKPLKQFVRRIDATIWRTYLAEVGFGVSLIFFNLGIRHCGAENVALIQSNKHLLALDVHSCRGHRAYQVSVREVIGLADNDAA